LKVGDTIVLCDAACGTVNLITFSTLQLIPTLCLKEEAPGAGSLCGSTFLNKRFEKFLEERLSSNAGWGMDTLDEALHRFETCTKRTFGGNLNDELMIPVPGIADNSELGVRRGSLKVSGKEMVEVFRPYTLGGARPGERSDSRIQKEVNAVFLVGGFGQSPYLRNYLRTEIPSEIEVIQVVNGWTAVVRGALTKDFADVVPPIPRIDIESRVARKHHGMIIRPI